MGLLMASVKEAMSVGFDCLGINMSSLLSYMV